MRPVLTRRLGVPAAVLLAAATAATATAAPAGKRVDEPAETRFVLFALEEFFQDTWPKPEGATYAQPVRTFIAQRERVVQELTARVREAKLGGEHNEQLIEELELYLKLVRDREKHAKNLDKCMDHITKRYVEIFGKANEDAARKRVKGAVEFASASASYLDRVDDPFTGLFGVLFLGMMSEAKTQLQVNEIRTKANGEFADYLKKEGKPEYEKKAAPVAKAFLDEFKKGLGDRRTKAESLARTIAAERKWKEEEAPFAARKPGEPGADHFSQKRAAKSDPVATDRGETREANDRMERAKKFMKAARDVPAANDRAYNYFRALCYGEAGREANRAAVLLGGSGGFSARKPNDASKLALQAWTLFTQNNDRDLTGEVLHNDALALVYNGRLIDAYALIKGVKPGLWPASPEFYYDVARVAALAAEDVANSPLIAPRQKLVQIPLLLQDASMALERAVWLGYGDFARARETADLKPLRDAAAKDLRNARTFQQFRTFEQIVGNK